MTTVGPGSLIVWRRLLGHDRQRSRVFWPQVVEVTPIERGNGQYAKPLTDRHDRGVRTAEVSVRVLADELGHPSKVRIEEIDELVRVLVGRAHVIEEDRFGLRTELTVDEVTRLGEHGWWDQQPVVRRGQPASAGCVVPIIAVGESYEHAGVDQDHWKLLPAESLGEDLLDSLGQVGAATPGVTK